MKIIFLDFDGVLNSERFMDEQELWDHAQPETMVDANAVKKLNEIIEATQAKVVISSSWRYFLELDKIVEILNSKGFSGEVIGRTKFPWINKPHMMHIQPKVFDTEHYRRFRAFYTNRGHEIQDWLDTNSELPIEKILILDDNNDMEHLLPNLVRTTWLEGMSDVHVAKAIRHLNENTVP